MYQNFIGIDIGKKDFYVAIDGQKKVAFYANSPKGFEAFYIIAAPFLKEALVILETTGGYEMALIRYLQNKKHHVHRANTCKVKHFIRSLGQLGKSDAIDAVGLLKYGKERQTSLPLFVENPGKNLLKLVSRRTELKQMIVQEKNRLKAPEQDELKKSFIAVIDALSEQMKIIEDEIEKIFQANPMLTQQKRF